MAEINMEGPPADDVEMDDTNNENGNVADDAENAAAANELPSTDVVDQPTVISFLDYLKSPLIQLAVGKGESLTTLSAHKDLLTKSPWFEQACASSQVIELPDDDLDAVGCVLEYLYIGEYFPKRIQLGNDLERDPRYPVPDESGDSLLRHARVYTLADKFMLPSLKTLAHSKINRTTSTARGEIIYARYVYAHTTPEDKTIRNPIAQFWATRSHVLRHEAEEEFRAMCIEYPQFGFDVLSRVLDQKEKSQGGGASVNLGGTPGGPGGRKGQKRPRTSIG